MNKIFVFGLLLTLAASLVAYALPDLQAGAYAEETVGYVGVPTSVLVTTGNFGSSTASSSITCVSGDLYGNGTNGTECFTIPPLNYTGYQVDVLTFDCPGAGTYPLYVVADYFNNVNESNETNNYKVEVIECSYPVSQCYLSVGKSQLLPGESTSLSVGCWDYQTSPIQCGGFPGEESVEFETNVGIAVQEGVWTSGTFTAQNHAGSGYVSAFLTDGNYSFNCSTNVTISCPCTAGCTCYGKVKSCTSCNCTATNTTCDYGCSNGACQAKPTTPTKPEKKATMAAAGVLGMGEMMDWVVVALIILALVGIYYLFFMKKK
ncbi:MAG: hypothetical protein NT157_03235 [Candidatus Micrarchaeota archaeon]|nr:hypothetical protein [Candidatus Micrarchaeota archaeon]